MTVRATSDSLYPDPPFCPGCGAIEPSACGCPTPCYFCGDPVDGTLTLTVDTDPGNPEVGPEPDIVDVPACAACHADPDAGIARANADEQLA